MALSSFVYSAPTIVWFSPGGLARLGSYLKRLGKQRALLVCDARLHELGVSARATEAAGGRIIDVWSAVEADAPRASIEAAAHHAKQAGADAIVALGGGSAIDTAKAAALVAEHGGDVARFDGANKVGSPGLPVIAIPTTAGTGSEASNIAVVKDPVAGRKLVILDRAVYPTVAIVDPELTLDLPAKLTAATGVDALSHAVEGVVSRYHQPICDAIGVECVRLVRAHLGAACASPRDVEARSGMMLAASMAGQLVAMTFSGVSHALAHALGVGFGVHHGTANAIGLPWSVRFNAKNAEAAAMYARCADAFGERDRSPEGLARALDHFIADVGLPLKLSEVGVTRADLPKLAALAFADPSHGPNPVAVESAAAFEAALESIV